MKGKKKLLSTLIVSLIAALLIFIPAVATPQNAEAATISPQVAKHYQSEIQEYYKNNGIDFNSKPTFKTNPSKYSQIGALSDNTQKAALAALNYYRYIAGLKYTNITLDSTYIKYAQSAAFYMDVTGQFAHEISKDSRVSDNIYKDADKGSSGNLSSGNYSIVNSVVSWMHENNNVSVSVGHRAKLLSPELKAVGFGFSNLSTPKGVIQSGRPYNNKENDMVVWPAQQTPIDAFANSKYWSISGISRDINVDKITVNITRKSDNKKWSLKKAYGNLYAKGKYCWWGSGSWILYFTPNIEPKAKDIYDVEVLNFGSDTLKYSVEFFDINDVKDVIEIKEDGGTKKVFKNGKFDPTYNGLVKKDKKWYFFKNGVYNTKYIGTSGSTSNPKGQFFVKNGTWDQTYTGLAKGLDGTWYFVKDGVYNTKYIGTSGSTSNPKGQFFVKNGTWDRSYTGLAKGLDGIWYFVKDGVHNTKYVGTSGSTSKPNGQFFVKNGTLDKSYTGLAKGLDGIWYFVKDGVYDTKYVGTSGSTSNPKGQFYVKNGTWDRSFTGLAKGLDGKWYHVKKGQFDSTFTGLSKAASGKWYHVTNGVFDPTFTGLSQASSGNWYYVIKGVWQKDFTGKITYNNKTYNIKDGKVV